MLETDTVVSYGKLMGSDHQLSAQDVCQI